MDKMLWQVLRVRVRVRLTENFYSYFSRSNLAIMKSFHSFVLILTSDIDVIAKINDFIEVVIERLQIPGLSLGIIRNSTIIHAKGYGYSNVEHQVPVKLETVFQSGSIGKQFTAMAIMMLIERGKLGLDHTIIKYFTDAPIEWNNIMIRHLLTHTNLRFDIMWSPIKLNNGTTFPCGFRSIVIHILDEKLTVVLFANLSDGNVVEIAQAVLQLYNSIHIYIT